MGGRWEGREGGRHREEEEQHKGREVRKAQNELHVHVYSVPDMYMYMLCQQCALHMHPLHMYMYMYMELVLRVPDLFPLAEQMMLELVNNDAGISGQRCSTFARASSTDIDGVSFIMCSLSPMARPPPPCGRRGREG